MTLSLDSRGAINFKKNNLTRNCWCHSFHSQKSVEYTGINFNRSIRKKWFERQCKNAFNLFVIFYPHSFVQQQQKRKQLFKTKTYTHQAHI